MRSGEQPTTLRDMIERNALAAAKRQLDDGSMPAGHNGPYRDPETPVRNTAHWLVTFSHVYTLTNCSLMLHAAHRATDYLMSREARPLGAEGLLAAGYRLDREDALALARTHLLAHPFMPERAIWRRLGVDGTYSTPDPTFNHQLWFAAIAASAGDRDLTEKAHAFLRNVVADVQTYSNGVIFHLSRLGRSRASELRQPREAARAIEEGIVRLSRWRSEYLKSVGYHAFNLYALAILRQHFSKDPVWRSKRIQRALSAIQTEAFVTALVDNSYGYPYNPAGIELAYACEVFELGHAFSQSWLERQYHETYEPHAGELTTRGVADVPTSGARIYEATRLRGHYEVLCRR